MSGSAVDGGRTAAPGQDADAGKVTVEHSPLPWRLDKTKDCLLDKDGVHIATCFCGEPQKFSHREVDKANAALIEAAVNSYDKLRDLLERSLDFVWEWTEDLKAQYKGWEGRESAGTARYLKEYIDEGKAIYAEARKVLGEEVGMGCAGAVNKTVYRVESEDGKLGLWRDADGTWNPKFHLLRDGKCKDMPMEDSEVYREGGKRWFASAPSRELLKEWFSLEDLCDLQKHGFGIYEFEVSQWKLVSEFECIFPRDAVVGRKEIGISEIYEEAEDGNS